MEYLGYLFWFTIYSDEYVIKHDDLSIKILETFTPELIVPGFKLPNKTGSRSALRKAVNNAIAGISSYVFKFEDNPNNPIGNICSEDSDHLVKKFRVSLDDDSVFVNRYADESDATLGLQHSLENAIEKSYSLQRDYVSHWVIRQLIRDYLDKIFAASINNMQLISRDYHINIVRLNDLINDIPKCKSHYIPIIDDNIQRTFITDSILDSTEQVIDRELNRYLNQDSKFYWELAMDRLAFLKKRIDIFYPLSDGSLTYDFSDIDEQVFDMLGKVK